SSGSTEKANDTNTDNDKTPTTEVAQQLKDFVLPPAPDAISDDITMIDVGGDVHVAHGDADFSMNRNDYINRGWLSSDTITLIGPNGRRLLLDRSQFLANKSYYINNGYLPSQHQILVGNDGRYVIVDNKYYNQHANDYKRTGYNIQEGEIGTGALLSDTEYIRLLEQYIQNGNKGPKPTRYK
ncbi:MAG: hypothetical protein LBI18_08050, partial [Planctomycetaceae bacterium]|nr:hypothetical protein [Planctomycetaceae bacterium]